LKVWEQSFFSSSFLKVTESDLFPRGHWQRPMSQNNAKTPPQILFKSFKQSVWVFGLGVGFKDYSCHIKQQLIMQHSTELKPNYARERKKACHGSYRILKICLKSILNPFMPN
jgi:hypothetical protein